MTKLTAAELAEVEANAAAYCHGSNQCVRLLADLRAYQQATQLCEKHQPDGGTRARCILCGLTELAGALDRICFVAEGEPNEMGVSLYSIGAPESTVIRLVERMATDLRAAQKVVEAARAYRRALRSRADALLSGTLEQVVDEVYAFDNAEDALDTALEACDASGKGEQG